MSAQRPWVIGAALSILVVSVAVTGSDPADASCVAPGIAVKPAEAGRGQVVTVKGASFSRECNDVFYGGDGTNCNPPPAASLPYRGIELVLQAAGWERVLAAVDGFRFERAVKVPADAPFGDAEVVARMNPGWRLGQPVPFKVAVGLPADDPLPPDPPPRSPARPGYLLAGADGGVFAFGSREYLGGVADIALAAPIVGVAASRDRGGYWLAGANGGTFAFGAPFHPPGLAGYSRCQFPAVGAASGIAGRPRRSGYWSEDSEGYWTSTDRGFVMPYGSDYNGSLLDGWPWRRPTVPSAPITGVASHPRGYGYWLAGADGGVFAYGEASFHGSLGGVPLAAPVVGMAGTPSGNGYWLVASDGGIFAFGDAPFLGAATHLELTAAIVGIAACGDGHGYWLAGADGGVFAFGSAPFLGSLAGSRLNAPVVGIAT